VPEWCWHIRRPEEWARWARWAAASLQPLRLALYGGLGAGKTTLVRAFGRVMGFEAEVSSPTFVLHHQYGGRAPVHHFDLYRLERPEQVEEAGFVEIWESAPIWFIEWPEVAEPYLTTIPHYALRLEDHPAGRRARLMLQGMAGTSAA